jgi:asparagine synthase (glutamine-hydrolysing)
MCGINGIFAYGEGAPPVDEAELLRTRERMIKRGPDGAGLWLSSDRRVGLAHRRLAIIDLSESGAQPMTTADGRLTVTFNGEIYNYRALRAELEAKGFVFRSQSDTEVLLHLYADRGAEMVHALRGMFAFGVWDAREQALFLARDPFGIKPLYYADDGGTIRFASQVKALLAGTAISPALDSAGVTGFYLWGFVPEPFTICRAIRALPVGGTLALRRRGSPAVRSYFSVAEELAAAARGSQRLSEDTAALGEVLRDSLRHHLVADVPVGVFLSAGLDSTTITALASEASEHRLHTLTLGFQEYRGTPEDEAPLAERVAALYGTRQLTSWITRADFEEALDGFLYEMDQPTTDGVNTYFVSRIAAQQGMKVALSGLGGDELFGGYPSFKGIPMLRRYAGFAARARWLGRAARRATVPLFNRVLSPKYASLLEYAASDAEAYFLRRALHLPWEIEDLLDAPALAQSLDELRTIPSLEASIAGVPTPHARVAALEMQWYMRNQLLRDSDWAGMAHSVEIRVPLIDRTLFRALAPDLVSGSPPGKARFASTPKKALPPDVLARAKTGFVVPVREWIVAKRGERSAERGLRGWARSVLPPPRRKRALALVTDAFGGRGGIALYNRDLLSAVCAMPEMAEVVAIPRLMPDPPGSLPPKLRYSIDGLGGKARYVLATAREVLRHGRFDVIFCGHVNLLPMAFLAWFRSRAPVVLCIYGIDAWTPPKGLLTRALVRFPQAVVSISDVTARRFVAWSAVPRERITILPNAIHLDWYGAGPKRADLVARYGLEGRAVIASMGRLVAEERYKGFDEVLQALPALVARRPGLTYLIMGEGSDRARLEALVASLGLKGNAVFTGFVDEREKADHFRLADAFVMPSRGEGFGFVVLEALACGVPAVGSTIDGTREALMGGKLGRLVDPGDIEQVREAILATLDEPRSPPSSDLAYFSYPQFASRAAASVRKVTGSPGVPPAYAWVADRAGAG